MRSPWIRLAPALFVGALLVLAAISPVRRAAFASAQGQLPPCSALQSGGSHADSFTCVAGTGLLQPLGSGANVVACSLDVDRPYYSSGQLKVQCFDPATLAPDPTTIALRSLTLSPSDLIRMGNLNFTFSPPVVGRQVSNLAEPPAAELSIAYRCLDLYNSQIWYFDPGAAGSAPVARVVTNNPASVTPLPGSHPVASHLFCGGSSSDQDHYVVQSVMGTSDLTDGASYELAQRFRVPVVVNAQWVELAFPVTTGGYAGLADLEIYDSDILGVPSTPLPQPLLHTNFVHQDYYNETWDATVPFDHPGQLVPGHDYYLLLRSYGHYRFYQRALTGAESPTFTASVGTVRTRLSPYDNWVDHTDRSLSFRLIGAPIGVIGVPRTEPALPRAFHLRVTPNPASGAAFVSWSGASGSVRLEVLDARGRRVAAGLAGGGEGRWRISGLRDDGRPLAAGIYFVRATDAGGRTALDRLVLIR